MNMNNALINALTFLMHFYDKYCARVHGQSHCGVTKETYCSKVLRVISRVCMCIYVCFCVSVPSLPVIINIRAVVALSVRVCPNGAFPSAPKTHK